MYRVAVVGDIMLDRYFVVETKRQAEECDIPVWDTIEKYTRLGGAANVAENIYALGSRDIDVTLFGLGDRYDFFVPYEARIMLTSTMVKNRFLTEEGQFVFRYDNFKTFHTSFDASLIEQTFDLVIFSDYDKGTIDKKVAEKFISASKLAIVDSKRADLSIFYGCDVLKLNQGEYSRQMAKSPDTHWKLVKGFPNIVITMGADGATLIRDGQDSKIFGVAPARVVDVTGCGDTHTAALGFSLLKNGDIERSINFANMCARQVVEKLGTSVALNHEQ